MSTVMPSNSQDFVASIEAFVKSVIADEQKLMLQPKIDLLLALQSTTDPLLVAAQIQLFVDKFKATLPQLAADVKAMAPIKTSLMSLLQNAIAKEQAKLAGG